MGDLSGKLARAGQQVAEARAQNGIGGIAAAAVELVGRAAMLPFVVAGEAVFDWRRGVRTRGTVRNEVALVPRSLGGDPEFYQPVYLRLWRRVQGSIPIDPGTATFLDLGAGRGRAVILAAETGYRRVIGVELDEQLAREAEENLRRWRSRCVTPDRPDQVIDIVYSDAATYPVPEGPLVMSLYNSFGPTSLRYLLGSLCETSRSSADPVFLAYFNPVHESVVAEFPCLTLHDRAKRWSLYRLAR